MDPISDNLSSVCGLNIHKLTILLILVSKLLFAKYPIVKKKKNSLQFTFPLPPVYSCAFISSSLI